MTILDKIEEYIARDHKQPLLVWFHSNSEIDEVRRSIMSIPGCVRCDKYIYEKDGVIIEKRAIVYNEDTRLFLFHPYFDQLKAPYLEYAVDLMNKTGIPVVYLANEYSKNEEPQADISAFEEWGYKCDAFITMPPLKINPDTFLNEMNAINDKAKDAIIDLLNKQGDKRYIALPDWEDECEGEDFGETEVSIFGIGLDDDDEICIAAIVDFPTHDPDDFPQEWTKATELWNPNYCAFYRFVADNIDKAMTKEEADEVTKEYWH